MKLHPTFCNNWRALLAPLPTAIELTRIRCTIDNLKANENLLRERMNEPRSSSESEELHRDNRRHAVEIAAGWEQLGRMVGGLPESFIDKALFAAEVERGMHRSGLLIEMAWGRLDTQR